MSGNAGHAGVDGRDVLVVDDEHALLDLTRVILESAGHTVRTADDGLGGLRAVAERVPDVLVLDVVMPRMDGWRVLDALAGSSRLADLPVIMLTALSSERDVIRAHLTGAVGYVTKPFEARDLLTAVEAAVAPATADSREERRAQVRRFLTRLAELDAGRASDGPIVRWSGLEPPRPRPTPDGPDLSVLTPRQHEVAALLGAGTAVRDIAARLGTSRTNVYASRARAARHLGCEPEEVAATARQLGLRPSGPHHDSPADTAPDAGTAS